MNDRIDAIIYGHFHQIKTPKYRRHWWQFWRRKPMIVRGSWKTVEQCAPKWKLDE